MTLQSWLEPLPDAADQRALDRWAIDELRIQGLVLMEQAGAGLADLVAARCPSGRIAIVCGKGNNGGDGYVAARLLRERGRQVSVLTVVPTEELSGDAKTNFERLPGPAPTFGPSALEGVSAIVDAILGTGAAGAPHGNAEAAIDAINKAGVAEVIACDIASGVDASTGEVPGIAVRATATATFHAAKPGHWVAPGKRYSGEVTVIDMTVPREDVDGALVVKGADALLERSGRADAVVLGPGMGRSAGSREFARRVARRLRRPLVLDADGLNAHAASLRELAVRAESTVLTPHEGELGRLLRIETDAVGAQRLVRVREAAAEADAVVVLKGDDTIVATPDGVAAINRGAAPALATAGTGDVLSGMIAAYLAKGMEPFVAACAAVAVHAHAARTAARLLGPEGVIASDVIEAMPIAFKEL